MRKSLTPLLFTLMCVLAGPSQAAYLAPQSKVVYEFQPQEYYFVDIFSHARTALQTNNPPYVVTRRLQHTYPGTNPTVRLSNFLTDVAALHGVWLHSSHGSDLDIVVEAYGVNPIDSDACDAAIQNYLNQGIGSPEHIYKTYGTGTGYAISVSSYFVSLYASSHNTLTFVSSCLSIGGIGGLSSSWTSGAFVGYNYEPQADDAKSDAEVFWDRMGGLNGKAYRSMYKAILPDNAALPSPNQLPLAASSFGSQDFVIAPAVAGISPAVGTLIKSPTNGYVEFDTEMNGSGSVTGGVTVSGNLTIANKRWAQLVPNGPVLRLAYSITNTKAGTGTVTLNNASCRAAGSADIYLNPDGVGLNTDTFSATYPTADVAPAIAVTSLYAELAPVGTTINISADWQSATDSLSVERRDPSGSWTSVQQFAASQQAGRTAYRISDPSGVAGDYYRVVERQAGDLADLTYGTCRVGEIPNIPPVETPSYDPDSLQGVVEAMGNPGTTIETGGIPGVYVLIAPDSLCWALGAYDSLWQSEGVSTSIVPISETDFQGGIKGYLEWAHFYNTQYALIVGDANDAAWWDDPARWINGWTWPRVTPSGPHIPSQPERNLIPTFYTADADSPGLNLAFYTPYFASDVPYGDFDDDGLPDMAIGRLPASSAADIIAYTDKLAKYLSGVTGGGNSWTNAYQITYAQDNGAVSGDVVEADADAVAAEFPGSVNLARRDDTNATLWEYAHRESLATAAANAGPDIITWLSSGAQRYIHGNYWRIDRGWSMSKLASITAPARFFVSLDLSCDMGNFDQTEEYAVYDSVAQTFSSPIRPIVERLLFDPQKGAIACIGPTRGTWQAGNAILGQAFLRILYGGGKNLGTALYLAQRTSIVSNPRYANQFRSYMLLGDPVIGGYNVTAVDESPGTPRIILGPAAPNPFNPSTKFSVTLSRPAKVYLRVFDTSGRLVRALANGKVFVEGQHEIRWDGTSESGTRLGSGVYFVRMEVEGQRRNEKVVLMR